MGTTTVMDAAAGEPRYAELHCTSNFSFLEGASHPEELVQRAHALGYEALAITDRATLAGIVRAHGAAQQAGIRLVVGARLDPVDAAPLVVWAADRTGYANLCRLLTLGHARAAEAGGEAKAAEEAPARDRGSEAGDAVGRLDRLIEKLDRLVDRLDADRRHPPGPPQPHRAGPDAPRPGPHGGRPHHVPRHRGRPAPAE